MTVNANFYNDLLNGQQKSDTNFKYVSKIPNTGVESTFRFLPPNSNFPDGRCFLEVASMKIGGKKYHHNVEMGGENPIMQGYWNFFNEFIKKEGEEGHNAELYAKCHKDWKDGSKPSTAFLINALEVDDTGSEPQFGELITLSMNATVKNGLVDLMGNKGCLNKYQKEVKHDFSKDFYPILNLDYGMNVDISKTGKGLDTKYQVTSTWIISELPAEYRDSSQYPDIAGLNSKQYTADDIYTMLVDHYVGESLPKSEAVELSDSDLPF